MMRPICFSCHEELHYISNRHMMCYNETCEKIYGMDYKCAPCSAKKRLEVLMEVVTPGEVSCILCGNRQEAPGLNLETMMKSETISRLGQQNREKQAQRSLRSTLPLGNVSETGSFRIARHSDPASQDKLSIFPQRPEPDIEEVDDGLIIIAEFPGHTLEQIRLHKEGAKLIIESTVITCPYKDEITLPNWAREPTETKLSNGVLTIKFVK